MKKVFMLLVLAFLLTACGQSTSVAPTSGRTPTPTDSAISDSFSSFSLPEGYTIRNVTDTSCDIIRDGVCVGSFVRTELDPNVIATADSDAILGYLESYVSEGMDYEYMMGHAAENPTFVEISMNLVTLDTMEMHEYQHYLFQHNDSCYDLRLDNNLVDGKARCDILISTGIDPNVQFIG